MNAWTLCSKPIATLKMQKKNRLSATATINHRISCLWIHRSSGPLPLRRKVRAQKVHVTTYTPKKSVEVIYEFSCAERKQRFLCSIGHDRIRTMGGSSVEGKNQGRRPIQRGILCPHDAVFIPVHMLKFRGAACLDFAPMLSYAYMNHLCQRLIIIDAFPAEFLQWPSN
jgi:hypothetical protein